MKDNQREVLTAYLAGIIDGEGSIRMQKSIVKGRSPKYNPSIAVTNTFLGVVEMVAEFLGGTKVFEDSGTNKPCYRTQMFGRKKVLKPLKELLPYLRIKRKQAEILIEFCERTPDDGRKNRGVSKAENDYRESVYKQLSSLNSYTPATTNRKDT